MMRRATLAAFVLLLVCATPAYGQSYYAFGDSITQGVEEPTYPQQLEALYEEQTGEPLTVHNYGVAGSASTNVLNSIASHANEFQDARLITVGIGFNDLGIAGIGADAGYCKPVKCYNYALKKFEANWNYILYYIEANCKPGYTTILFRNNYTLIPTSWLNWQYTTYLNAYIKSTASAYGIGVYDTRSDFNGLDWLQPLDHAGWLAPDNIHPNAQGNAVIARGYSNLGFNPNCGLSQEEGDG